MTIEGRLDAHERHVEPAADERLGEVRRIVARNRDLDVLQLVAQHMPALRRSRKTAFLDHGHEITQVPQLHSRSMPERYATSLQSLFQDRNASLDWVHGSTPVNR
jgi:hypothetical protein